VVGGGCAAALNTVFRREHDSGCDEAAGAQPASSIDDEDDSRLVVARAFTIDDGPLSAPDLRCLSAARQS
ncbi:MAG: hypothetical protein ACI9KE_005014, partial [Polyangiales bacterium]